MLPRLADSPIRFHPETQIISLHLDGCKERGDFLMETNSYLGMIIERIDRRVSMLPFRRILCPTDFSDPAHEGLNVANEMARHFSADLYLVHVVSPVPAVAVPAAPSTFNVALYIQELVKTAQKELSTIINTKITDKNRVHPIVVEGVPAQEILRVAGENQVDLIVMATHGQTGWRHLVFGSVAERVVREAPCPVLVVHRPKDE
jgi:nucleotide-binding universal stress UspA family protein